jgi:hypothetical protein
MDYTIEHLEGWQRIYQLVPAAGADCIQTLPGQAFDLSEKSLDDQWVTD